MKIFGYSLIVCVLISSCANIVSPTGGPKDIQGPKVIQATPQNLSTRFTGNNVTILFDEYVKLENPSQEIIISPSIQPEAKIHVKGKKLVIEFKDAVLDSNTTYTINFGESLKDVNESNVLSNFQYVFSTGNIVDSLYISGKVLQAKDQKPAEKVLVMLHKENSETALLKNKPFYFTKTDASGGFQFSHISSGKYQIFSLRDENYNYIYDLPNEEIAFSDSVLNVDTSLAGIKLNNFREEKEGVLERMELDDSRLEYTKLIYSKGVDTLAITSFEDSVPVAVSEYNKTRDTILSWYIRAIDADTLRLMVNNDSIEKIKVGNMSPNIEFLKDTLSKFILAAKDSLIASEGFISAVLNHPVKAIEWGRVVVQQDSPQLEIKSTQLKFSDGSSRHILLDFPRKPETKYSVMFPAGMMTDYFETPNDSLTWKARTKSDEDYGSLALSIAGHEGQHYIMQMIDIKNENIVKEHPFTETTRIEFNKIQPASYEIRIIYDSNKNGKWDTGNFLKRIQPERVYAHPENINVRANWELEAELKLE